MKKSLKILILPILAGLFCSYSFGLSFSNSGSLSVSRVVNGDGGNSNAYFLQVGQYGGLISNLGRYYKTTDINAGDPSFWTVGDSFFMWINHNLTSDTSFSYIFTNPYGFSITGLDNWVVYGNNTQYVDNIFGVQKYNSLIHDRYPLIFDKYSQEYLTFINETTLIYNGNSINFGDYGLLKYCFYGNSFSLSCVFSDNGYKFLTFIVSGNVVNTYENFLYVPVYNYLDLDIYRYTQEDGGVSYILGIDNDRIVYNYYSGVFDNPLLLSNDLIIDKGFFNGLSLSNFGSRLNMQYSPYVVPNGPLGYFGEIVKQVSDNNLYFRTNYSYFTNNGNTSTSYTKCLDFPQLCMGYLKLNPVSDDSVGNILDSIGGGVGGIVDDVSIINTCEDVQTSQNVIDNCVNQYGTGTSFYSCVISNCIQTNKTGSSVTIYNGDGSGSYFTIEYGGQTFTFYTTQSGFVDNSGLNLDMSSLNIALGYKSGLLTTGLVIDMLDNLTGWIGKCPFPYTDFQLGQNSNILKALKLGGFDYDPFIPINCFVAGWDYGRHYFSNNRIDTHFDGPILKGNNNEYKSLYMFFDFIIILFLISFAHFIKKLF